MANRGQSIGLQPSPFASDAGNLIGRDPRELSASEYLEHRDDFPIGLKAIRAKCLDCSYTPGEVRRCVCVTISHGLDR